MIDYELSQVALWALLVLIALSFLGCPSSGGNYSTGRVSSQHQLTQSARPSFVESDLDLVPAEFPQSGRVNFGYAIGVTDHTGWPKVNQWLLSHRQTMPRARATASTS